MSSRSDIISSPKKKARKSDKKERLEKQNALMKLANEHAEECDAMFNDKLGALLGKYKDWIGVSKIGIFAPFLALTSFFMHRAIAEDSSKKMKQPVSIWVQVVAYPGCKKTSIFKIYHENLEKFTPHYMRDFIQHCLKKVMRGGGTTEAWRKELCDPMHSDGNSVILSNEFNTILDDLDKYSSSKGDKSLLCNMFDGIGISRSTVTDGEMNVDKVNISIAGMIQPDFALMTMEPGNDSHGLFRRFFTCAPSVDFPYYEDTANMPDGTYYMPAKVWLVIVCDEVIGQSDAIYSFSNQAKETYKAFFNKKSDECKYYSSVEKQHMIANSSKSRDLVLRVAPVLQVIEMSLDFLEKHPNFEFSRRNDFTQPLIPGANLIQSKYVENAIMLVESFQKQWDLLSGEDFNNEEESGLKSNIEKDVLMHRDNFIKNASALTKRNNPFTGMKHSTVEYEDAFKSLVSKGIGKIDRKVARNNTAYLAYTKIPYSELAASVDIMDKWPSNVSLKEYDRAYEASKKRSEAPAAPGNLELNSDPIQED